MGWTLVDASFLPNPANSASGGRKSPGKASPSSPEIVAVLLESLDELPADFLGVRFSRPLMCRVDNGAPHRIRPLSADGIDRMASMAVTARTRLTHLSPRKHGFNSVRSFRTDMQPLIAAHYIRNTPNRVSGMGAFSVAAKAKASTRRVSAGAMMPSSHSRAVA